MKQKNRFRSSVPDLEKSLPIKARIFSIFAVLRGLQRLRRWTLWLLVAAPIIAGIAWGVKYTIDKAYSLSIDKITYTSRQNLISREQAFKILGIEGSINMTEFDAPGMQKALTEHPCIQSARIRAELPDTLTIEIDERIPIVYVEMQYAADTGSRTQYFMDPNGVLFPVTPEYHRNFLGVPIWYLQPGAVSEFKCGAVVDEKNRRPIVELVAASNRYNLTEIPAIKEIFRPKEWKIIITLENGVEVLMQVYDIRGQMERLAMILEHARATGKKVRSTNVIPRINPTVNYIEQPPSPEPKKEDKKEKSTRRR